MQYAKVIEDFLLFSKVKGALRLFAAKNPAGTMTAGRKAVRISFPFDNIAFAPLATRDYTIVA